MGLPKSRIVAASYQTARRNVGTRTYGGRIAIAGPVWRPAAAGTNCVVIAEDGDIPAQLTVATANIWGRHGNLPQRRELLRSTFAKLDADLVALQETIANGTYDQAADIMDASYHV